MNNKALTNTEDIKKVEHNGTKRGKSGFISSLTRIFNKIFKKVDSVLYPQNIKCVICNDDLKEKQKIEVCEKCLPKLEFIQEDKCCQNCGAPIVGEARYCLNCKNEEKDFDLARSVFVYTGEIAMLIAGLKYNNKPFISRTLGQFLSQKLKDMGWEIDLIVPVPLTDKRLKWRGFNQAEFLARVVSEELGIPLIVGNLVKTEDTDTQASLNLEQRKKNLLSSFKVTDKTVFRDKRVLIIDDVMTSGSTASACARVLKKARAKNVYALAVAHGKMDIPSQSSLKDIKNLIKSTK